MLASKLLERIKEAGIYRENQSPADAGKGKKPITVEKDLGMPSGALSRLFGGIPKAEWLRHMERLKALGCVKEEIYRAGDAGRPSIRWYVVGEIQPALDFPIRRPKVKRVAKAIRYEYNNDMAGDQPLDNDYLNEMAKDGWDLHLIAPLGQWIWRRPLVERSET